MEALYVWFGLIVLFVVLEASTATLVSFWFALGSVGGLIAALVQPQNYVLQVLVFLVISVLTLLALRPMARKLIGSRKTPTNADANVGKTCQVVSEVQPGRFGRAKLEGLVWTAKSDYVLPVGSWARVDAIEGVKLVVSPISQPLLSEEEE